MRARTYLIYIILYEGLVLGGTGYAVFVLGHSGWWFLLAALFSAGASKPDTWINGDKRAAAPSAAEREI